MSGNRDRAKGNRLAFFADRHFEYDRFGNLIAERRGKGHKLLTTYEYDCRHRLIKHTAPDGRVTTYAYDTFNRRISKTVDDEKTEFIWQGNRLIAESRQNDKVWQSYIYEPDSFRPLALVEGHAKKSTKTRTFWYQNDQLGSPIKLTDSLGDTVYECEYNAYGQLTEERGPLADNHIKPINPRRLPGQYFDEESGLHYNLNRYYDPDTGRYITQDPLGIAGGLNPYQYCQNPVNWIDPLGLFNVSRNGFEGVVGKGKRALNYKATSGALLVTDPNKTTTILGTYMDDTQYIIKELNLEKSIDFGSRKGGFNLLNTPDEFYQNPIQFWNEYNKPWLDNVIKRGDNIILATKPIASKLYRTNEITGVKELSGFRREYHYLLKNGYKFDSKTNQMIKGN